MIEHRGASPRIDPTAYVAPSAVISGDVTIGADARLLHGAVITAEDGSVSIGARVVVMENALVRGRSSHPVSIGNDVMIGPHAHVNGATIGDEVFIATTASSTRRRGSGWRRCSSAAGSLRACRHPG